MNLLDYLPLLSFLFFTGLVGFTTWWLTHRDDHSRSSSNYFLAGRSLSFGVIAGSLMLTNLSTEQLVGLNGAAFKDGFVVMAWEVIPAFALVLMALFFLPYYLRSGIATVPQFLHERFDTTTRTITTLIFIVAYAAILLPIILYTGATGLISMLDMETLLGVETRTSALWIMVWVIGLIGSVYAIFGGLRTVAISDTINGIGLLIGGLLIAWLGLQAVGDGNAFTGLSTLVEEHPEKFESIGTAEQSVPFSTIFTGVLLLNLFYWCTNQQIIQRTFGASNLAEGQKGVLLAGGLKIFTPLILVLPGVIAFHLYADQIGPDDADNAYGMLVLNILPFWLTGFFAAVVVGAVLSSFNSALNSCATLFSYGVYKSMARPQAEDAEVIRAGKYFATVIALIAMLIAPFLAGFPSIFAYLQQMNGLYFIPIFAVLIVGILFRRVPAVAANVALIVGCLAIAAGYFIPALNVYVDRMHEFHFLGAVFITLVAIMLVIGALKPRAEGWQQIYSGDVDMTPWPHAKWVSGLLLLIVVVIYVTLANI
ncbi:MAG: solute:sodium symporter family transporter [Phycisphaeraceae bacterium]